MLGVRADFPRPRIDNEIAPFERDLAYQRSGTDRHDERIARHGAPKNLDEEPADPGHLDDDAPRILGGLRSLVWHAEASHDVLRQYELTRARIDERFDASFTDPVIGEARVQDKGVHDHANRNHDGQRKIRQWNR